MAVFRVPLIWEMYGHVYVEAQTEEEAIEIALGPDTPIPEGDYVDESVRVDGWFSVERIEEVDQ